MSRSLPKWIGKSDDTPIPPRVQLRVFERHGGTCQCGCGCKIYPGQAWDCDHIVALINGGRHCESNLQPLLAAHHKHKTRTDVAIKSKTYRMQARHLGVKRRKGRPMPGSKDSKWKIRMDGTVVLRSRPPSDARR